MDETSPVESEQTTADETMPTGDDQENTPAAEAEQVTPAPDDLPAAADTVTPLPPDEVPPLVEPVEVLATPVEVAPAPEAVNPLAASVGRGGVYIREMGGDCRQMVTCTLVEARPDGTTRIRLTPAAGVKAGEIIATYSEQHVPGTWHWA